MSDGAEQKFIAEGIRRYANAVSTIRAFETMLNDRLREIAKAYQSPAFTPARVPTTVGVSKGAFGDVIWAVQEGKLKGRPGEASLEFGVWWHEGEVALYCGLLDEKHKGIAPKVKKKHARVEFQKWSGKSRMFMLVDSNLTLSLEDEFKVVIDELLSSFL